MKKYLITGSTGFLGSIISKEIKSLGNRVVDLSRSNSDINVDLSLNVPNITTYFDVVVHAAGLAHESGSNSAFDKVNFVGTKNLLKGLEENKPSLIVFLSSVSVYGLEKGYLITEERKCVPRSDYGISKLKAEQYLVEWGSKFDVPVLSLRLPLVYGDGAPGNLGGMISMIRSKRYIRVKGNTARKSVVHAVDVARFIANAPLVSGVYNLTDGYHPSFNEIEEYVVKRFNGQIRLSLPLSLLRFVSLIGDGFRAVRIPFPLNSERLEKLTSTLTFDDSKARRELLWKGRPIISHDEVHNFH